MTSQKRFGLVGVGLLLLANCELSTADTVSSVSSTESTIAAGAGSSLTPAFSADGRYIVFVSHANNLVTNDDLAPYFDVFVRDLTTSNTLLVSVNMTGVGGGNADANSPSISSNGQFIAFVSAASNLVNNDTNDAPDIFVRDLISGSTTLVSVDASTHSSPKADDYNDPMRFLLSGNPIISADGRWVAFESRATSLVTLPDLNGLTDVFVRDLQSNTTYLVSVNAAGTATGNGFSWSPNMTPDGRFIVFVSTSTNLVSGVNNSTGDIYVRDLQAGQTVWVSTNVPAYLTNNYGCFTPILSADGSSVAFKAARLSDPATVLLIHHDLRTGASTVLTRKAPAVSFFQIAYGETCGGSFGCPLLHEEASAASFPEISADGRFVASESLNDVYVWDLQNGSNMLVSVNASGSGPANQPSHTPVMTPDGGRVAFLSAATDLTTDATNGISQVFVRDLASGTTRLVSANVDGFATSRDIDEAVPAISADGLLVAFESMGGDLVANDLNQASDIFLRDLDSGTTRLVSERHPGLPSKTAAALSTLFAQSLSADGRHVAIGSFDSNLTSNDTNSLPDVFVRDLSNGTILPVTLGNAGALAPGHVAIESVLSPNGRYLVLGVRTPCLFGSCQNETLVRCDLEIGTNELASVRFDGGGPPDRSCSARALSSDGNLVAFHSDAGDLISGLSPGVSNVYVRDMLLHTNKLVSINRQGSGGGDRSSMNPMFSPDDRWIVFASIADNLTPDLVSGWNLFARDLMSNTTRRLSVGPNGIYQLGYSGGAVFSADSAHVAFATATNSLAIYDFLGRTSLVVSAVCEHPSLSADGRLVAYETRVSSNEPKDIVVQDVRTGFTNLISRNLPGTGGGNGDSTSPLLSWDGRFVVFTSRASDLVDNDNNKASDIFVRDRLLGTTLLVSMNLQGNGTGNGASSKPVLGADGRTVVFQSMASDLVPGDYNDRRDVFVLRLGGQDTDGDGMDDDWEMAYFGTLARDGKGDFDGDGLTDLQEFLAGTDPTNRGSILRVMTLSSPGSGGVRVIWIASPGKTYQVQYKDGLGSPGWSSFPGTVLACGTTASYLDDSASAQTPRFYRVVLKP